MISKNCKNNFRHGREDFLKRYFCFPEDLENSIKLSSPKGFNTYLCGDNPLHRLAKYDKPERLFRILDLVGFNKNFNWWYLYNDGYCISDWCALFWREPGELWLHFEWMNIQPATSSIPDIDMNDDTWEFFFSKRKKILTRFLGGRFIEHFKEEDLAILLAKKPTV